MLPAALTAEQEAEAKVLEAKIQKAIQTEIADLARLMVSKSDRELFGRTEFQVRRSRAACGRQGLRGTSARKMKNGYRGSGVTCPKCGQAADFAGLSSAQAFKHHWANRVPTRSTITAIVAAALRRGMRKLV